MTREIIYVGGKAIGLGHLLFSLSYYQNIALKFNLLKYLHIKNTSFYSESYKFFNLLNKNHCNWSPICHFSKNEEKFNFDLIVLGRRDQRKRLEKEAVLQPHSNQHFIDIHEFRAKPSTLYERLESKKPLKLIIDSVAPVQSTNVPCDELKNLSPPFLFSDSILHEAKISMPKEAYASLHFRCGNGEYLSGRPEAGSKAMSDLIMKMIEKVAKLKESYSFSKVLVFGDNYRIASDVAKEIGPSAISMTRHPELPFQRVLKEGPVEKDDQVKAALIDLTLMANSQIIVAGSSFFPLAAKIYSKPSTNLYIERL